VILLFIALSTTPLWSIKKETRMILDELQKISEIVGALDKKVNILNAELLEMSKKVEILGERISAMSNNQADFSQSKDSIVINLQAFKEELSELKNQLNRLNERVSAPLTQTSTDPTPQTQPRDEKPSGQDVSNIYYTAYSDYIKENYDIAIEGFRQYLTVFPDSVLADNALYWIGECYYAKKKYTEAITAFNEVISRYKDGDKVPSAILKKGFALLEMGRHSDGMATLKELIARFPFKDEATLARQKIKDLSEQ